MAMIPWWIHYPNVNNEIINLDWILQVSNENTDKIENFIGINTIKYADPILWDITSQYEANTIVVDPQNGDAYISTKAVPYGVALSNDSYWTRIYNYASEIHVFREQIAVDEQLSTTATAPRSVDDLVFLNGLLYRITAPMIAGDSYVEDSNCVKTTINAELLRLHTSIGAESEARANADNAEAEARAEADTALGQRIDDEAEARADADTALGQRIDDEAQARAEADQELREYINDHIVYNPSSLDGTGSNIGLKEGDYSVSSNLTINAQLVIPEGAIITIASGVTLTINSQILAGRYKIFDGMGSVIINNEVQPVGYPEWFGAKADGVTDSTSAIQKCLDAFKITSLAAGDYLTSDTLKLTSSDSVITGVSLTFSKLYNTGGTRIVLADSGKTILQVGQDDYASDTQQLHNTVKHLTLARSVEGASNSKGLLCAFNQSARLTDIRVTSSAYAFYYDGAIRPITTDCQAIIENLDSNITEFCGYEVFNAAHPSMSVYFEKCTSENYQQYTGTSVGLRIEGTPVISDMFIDKLEVANFTYGIVLSGSGITSGIGAQDIFVRGCVLDMIKEVAVYVPIMPNNVMINIENCYLSHGYVTGGSGLIAIASSFGGINILNNQLCETLASASIGIILTNCGAANIVNNIIKDASLAGVSLNTVDHVLSENIIDNYVKNLQYGVYANNIVKSIIRDCVTPHTVATADAIVITNATSSEVDITRMTATAIGSLNGTTVTGPATVDTCVVVGVA